MEYFREAINSTKGRNAKSKPPLGGVYKDVETNTHKQFYLLVHSCTTFGLILERENPGPQRKLGFPDFPPITEIDVSGNTKDKIAVRNNAGKTTPAAPAPMANAYANATILAK
ncbi:hypothetical protein DY000_02059918 [Brassica cretica]|uniref:Uncharacterized protein n=1 Tax=Brassica cretica TaxID=69181 RepID=A0ABQ7ARF1_BRACR|nr:hypothetical protein DY000_02059918 [Brassica cretica]